MTALADVADVCEAHVVAALAQQRTLGKRCLVVGLCGAQGSGKSTAAGALVQRLTQRGLAVATLSLDDLYLTREEREILAKTVHPLLRTRGVPGTHDIALGLAIVDKLIAGHSATLPRFDKARDTRAERESWQNIEGPVDIILFEGWCVGARPQAEAALLSPINTLEQERDTDGRWRSYANTMLATEYQALFASIDTLILLAAPGFEVVAAWREQQEQTLRQQMIAADQDVSQLMDAEQIAQFIAHYERLTRHILADMPSYADLVIAMDAQRRVKAVNARPRP